MLIFSSLSKNWNSLIKYIRGETHEESVMTTDSELVYSLKKAAEGLAKRTLTQAELERLLQFFRASGGSHYQKARSALIKFTNLNETQLLLNTAASDNLERIMRELKQAADNWKPGT